SSPWWVSFLPFLLPFPSQLRFCAPWIESGINVYAAVIAGKRWVTVGRYDTPSGKRAGGLTGPGRCAILGAIAAGRPREVAMRGPGWQGKQLRALAGLMVLLVALACGPARATGDAAP